MSPLPLYTSLPPPVNYLKINMPQRGKDFKYIIAMITVWCEDVRNEDGVGWNYPDKFFISPGLAIIPFYLCLVVTSLFYFELT